MTTPITYFNASLDQKDTDPLCDAMENLTLDNGAKKTLLDRFSSKPLIEIFGNPNHAEKSAQLSCKRFSKTVAISYPPTLKTLYAIEEKTGILRDLGILSLETAQENPHLLCKDILNRLMKINEILPDALKHKGSLKALIKDEELLISYLNMLYEYSLKQCFKTLVEIPEEMSLNKSREKILEWLSVKENIEKTALLELNSQNLFCLPKEIGRLTNLIELWLNDNLLSTIPPEIGNLTNLVKLWLDDNLLSTIPSGIGCLTKLARLGLRNNSLTSLPSEIENLTAETILHLDEKQCVLLPPDIKCRVIIAPPIITAPLILA
jgi:hypothetical protein